MVRLSRSHLGALAGFFAVGTFLMVAYVLWQMLHPVDLGKFNQLELDVPNGEVKAGTLVFYEAKDCDPAQYSADVFRTLVTNTVPPEVTLSAGSRFDDRLLCRNVVLIPSEAPTGDYRLSITVEYHINAFQNRNVTYTSKVFRVVNEKEEFNILKDAIRNEKELQDGDPQSPATRTTPQSNIAPRQQIATQSKPGRKPTPPKEEEPSPLQVLDNLATDALNSINEAAKSLPLIGE